MKKLLLIILIVFLAFPVFGGKTKKEPKSNTETLIEYITGSSSSGPKKPRPKTKILVQVEIEEEGEEGPEKYVVIIRHHPPGQAPDQKVHHLLVDERGFALFVLPEGQYDVGVIHDEEDVWLKTVQTKGKITRVKLEEL